LGRDIPTNVRVEFVEHFFNRAEATRLVSNESLKDAQAKAIGG
jgi:hypothetical protein